MECNLEKGMYRSIMVRGTQEDLQNLATWARMLMERTIAMIDRRFPSEVGGLLWSASLFDRRTWPLTDMKFAIQEVEMKLQGIKRNFPSSRALELHAGSFVALAQKVTHEVPPVRSVSGRIRGSTRPLQNIFWKGACSRCNGSMDQAFSNNL